MQRRELLKIGVGLAAIPATGIAQTSNPRVVKAPPRSDAAWTPSFFNYHQNETMTLFSDTVIPTTDTPGAKEALVNRYLDKLLAASDAGFQNEFTGDLAALDRFSNATAGSDFIALSSTQQAHVLEAMFASDQRPSFDRLKAWTARIYYATKPGFDELNKGGRVPPSFACGT